MTDPSPPANPFVGPRPLETGQAIFGRDREIDELYYLLSAERIVLLHSPSGAGKSSLVRAGLVPRLQQRFDVRGPTRVNTLPSPGVLANRYVLSANLGFEQDLPKAHRRDEQALSRLSLAEAVASRARRRSAPGNVVLVFDQFEEILTADPLALDAKRVFFDQLGELLQDTRIWALFALREDYLAPLDPYASRVPTHLKSRLRVNLLGREAAQAVMRSTAQLGGRSFTADALEQLAQDLATVQLQQPDGSFEKRVGADVEPLHLQVACHGLWARMPADDKEINTTHITSHGSVTEALSQYCAGVMAALGSAERTAREWVAKKLITPNGIRSQVLKGAGESEGLDNRVVAQLVDAHLVRAEQRAGATWFELAHDRLVEPVRQNNERWFELNLSPVEKTAAAWEAQDRPPGLLMLGDELRAAQDWAAGRANLTDDETEFLQASAARQAQVDKESRQASRLRWLSGLSTAVSVLAVLAGAYAWKLRAEAEGQKTRAEQQTELALQQQSVAEQQKLRADDLARRLDAQLKISQGSTGAQGPAPASPYADASRALTTADLLAIMPGVSPADRAAYLQPLNAAMAEFAINTPLRQAHFLGEVAYETADLRAVQEIWNPAAASWQSRYEGRRDLGNVQPGDGQRYLGRGVFQLVGRANYKKYGDALGIDLLAHPELAARPDLAVRTGAIFWKLAGLNALADVDDLPGIARRISGGLQGLDQRKKAVDRAKAALGVPVGGTAR